MIVEEIRTELYALQDESYQDMQRKLMPTVDPATCIGVRTPALRAMAKRLAKREDIEEFLGDLPHTFFDENQVHAFVIAELRDFDACVAAVDRFLPYVDNWATCDQLSPRVFGRHRAELKGHIREWMSSDRPYTVRFGIGMLMQHYLDEDFDPAYLDAVAAVRSEEYYVRMMVAWYFATALAKQPQATLPYLEELRLEPWTHNKAVQKAIESRRIPPELKDYLRGLRVKVR